MKIFIIGMPGCANLGDDLISQIIVNKIDYSLHPREIGILCGENEIASNYQGMHANVVLLKKPRKISYSKYIGRLQKIKKFIKTTDLIIIGGGGLFQDLHSPFTIHNYMKYIQYTSKTKIIFVGIGVGPIKYKINKIYLKHLMNLKNLHIQVRDIESKIFLENIGVINPITIDKDIVEGSPIPQLNRCNTDKNNYSKILGCNIRDWPDIDIFELVSFINNIVKQNKINQIDFFVFENGINNNNEKKFAYLIISELHKITNIPLNLYAYNEISNYEFYYNFFKVQYAIASRYHANILWQKASIPTIPIAYASKVSNLYRKYNTAACSFKELISCNAYNFIIFNSEINSNNYTLPELPEYPVKLKLKVRFIITVFNISEFIYSIFKSILIRL